MKRKDPAFLFYSSDFLTGTMTMTDEQVGMYIRLLCLQHQKGELTEKDIKKVAGDDPEVKEKFTKLDNGNYVNVRLKHEADRRKDYSESRRENKNGGKKSSKDELPELETHEEDMSNICETHVEHMENEIITEILTTTPKMKIGGAGEKQERYLVHEVLKVFTASRPGYLPTENDNKPAREIYEWLAAKINLTNARAPDMDEVIELWSLICTKLPQHKFYSTKELSTISKHMNDVYGTIENKQQPSGRRLARL